MEKKIIENNKLIAEFMQDTIALNCLASGQDLEYHSSWDWLMPVIEKICFIMNNEKEFFYPRTFGMTNHEGDFMFRFNMGGLYTEPKLIDAAFKAVVAFIKDPPNPHHKP